MLKIEPIKEPTGRYHFEILCIEPEDNDIKSEQALVKALSFSDRLWNGTLPNEGNQKGKWVLTDDSRGIALRILAADTSKMLTSYFETAFIVGVDCDVFDTVESFRTRLLRHLRNTLKFRHISILSDDVSIEVANRLYPLINDVESLLRRYLTKFFIQRVGLGWWEATATRLMVEKVNQRMGDRRDEISALVDLDVALADFDDLGELIYKQSSGFNNPEKIISKLLASQTIEEFQNLQSELQGNYTKYFKEFFQDKQFEPKWKELYRIRNKVAHHGTFYKYDLERGLQLTQDLKVIIADAEQAMDEIVFSMEEKEAIHNAAIQASTSYGDTKKDKEPESEQPFRATELGLKIIGKVNLDQNRHNGIINEVELLDELESAASSKFNSFVGLKWFVTTYLFNRGYAIPPTYSLVNILIDKGKINVYDVPTRDGYNIKAVEIAEEPED